MNKVMTKSNSEFLANHYRNYISKVIEYCHNKNYTVHFLPMVDDSILFEEKRILINSKHSLEKKLYLLLHELGHLLLLQRKKYK